MTVAEMIEYALGKRCMLVSMSSNYQSDMVTPISFVMYCTVETCESHMEE